MHAVTLCPNRRRSCEHALYPVSGHPRATRRPTKQLSRIYTVRCVSLSFMSTDHILALLISERDKLTAAIEALQGPMTTEKTPGPGRKAVTPSVEQDSKPPANVDPTAPAKRKMSAAGRRAIIAGTKKRWAAVKAAKAGAAAPAPVAATPKAAHAKAPVSVRKGSLTAAGRKALSVAMKKRWSAKKKAAAKGK
jgi:hypothetical protein